MFKDARSFNQPLNNWDVSNVDYMNHMFEDACIARPRLTPSLVLMGRRRTTLDLDAISDLVVRPGVREGLAKASWGRSTRRDVLGK